MVSDNHNGGLLWFHGSLVNPLTGSDRSNAFAVRCVQHLHGRFGPAVLRNRRFSLRLPDKFPEQPSPTGRTRQKTSGLPERQTGSHQLIFNSNEKTYFTLGPAATRLLPSSLPVNFTKFFTKRLARSSALVSHSLGFL